MSIWLPSLTTRLRVNFSQWQWRISRFVSFSKEVLEKHVKTRSLDGCQIPLLLQVCAKSSPIENRRVPLQFKDIGLQICSGFSLHLQGVHFRNAVVDPCDQAY
jgi:hypothetical protein